MSRERRPGARPGAVLGRRIAAAVAGTVVVGVGVAMLTGTVGVVTTTGRSMNPAYHDGDLVVVAPTHTYAVGQIVAYRDHVHDLVVLHRIVGGGPAGFELKGDANAAVDTVRPPQGDLIGRAVLHVPGAGARLGRLARPVPLGAAALVLVAACAIARTRRRRRSPAMSRHAARRGTAAPPLRTAAAAVAMVGVVGLALGVLTWTTPVRTTVSREQPSTRSMTFSYAAAVVRSAAYDGTTVRSPDPVFRRLANAVDVRLAYDGAPGTLTVTAELSADNGWRASIPLAAPRDVPGRYDTTVRLDLAALERRAHAAAAVTGLPVERIAVAVTPRLTGAGGIAFAPALRLTLTPLQLVLAGGPATLTVAETTSVRTTETAPRRLSLLSRSLSVATGRAVSAGLLLATLAAALVLAVLARRTVPETEGALIRRRYATRLLQVRPAPFAPGDAIVDVVTFADLVRLADRYGLLVLHWSRSDVDTFVVREQGTTYRYRSGAGSDAGQTSRRWNATAASPRTTASQTTT